MLPRYRIARRRMTASLEERGLLRSEAVKRAFLTVPRECFVPEALAGQAYLDEALFIGEGQTVSKPSTIARMLEALDPEAEDILEIGTGSGYATALLASLARRVCTIERHRRLGLRARRAVQSLGFGNVSFKTGDGSVGWAEQAPFTRILATAQAREVPPALRQQLAPGGILVIPLGERLYRVLRTREGFETDDLGSASFVPFVNS